MRTSLLVYSCVVVTVLLVLFFVNMHYPRKQGERGERGERGQPCTEKVVPTSSVTIPTSSVTIPTNLFFYDE